MPQGPSLTVTKKETRLRTHKRLLAPPVVELHEGDRVVQQQQDGNWIRAEFRQKVGWLHSSDVSAKTDVVLSGTGVGEKVSMTEAGAARKGFNPQVEQRYREDNPNLAAAFASVDAIQSRTIDEDAVRAVLRAGRLGAEAER